MEKGIGTLGFDEIDIPSSKSTKNYPIFGPTSAFFISSLKVVHPPLLDPTIYTPYIFEWEGRGSLYNITKTIIYQSCYNGLWYMGKLAIKMLYSERSFNHGMQKVIAHEVQEYYV